MSQETPQIVIQDVPMVDFTSFFSNEDTSQNLKKFLDSIGKEKKQDQINYFWPTEIDPNAHDVVNWAIDNSATVFPNLTNEEKYEL